MSPLERLLAEELPTGTFGGRTEPKPAVTPERAAANRAALEKAVSCRAKPRPAATRRHLTPVPDQPLAETTRSAA